MNLNSQIGYSLRWLLGGCFGLVLACLCVPLVGTYATSYMREALSVVLKLWFIGAGVALLWGWYRGAKILMSLNSDGNNGEREE